MTSASRTEAWGLAATKAVSQSDADKAAEIAVQKSVEKFSNFTGDKNVMGRATDAEGNVIGDISEPGPQAGGVTYTETTTPAGNVVAQCHD